MTQSKTNLPAALLIAITMSGCQSIEGYYAPDCIAYEGETIELKGGTYTWNKFTDTRRVNDAGEIVDPFPGFPKTGRYMLSGAQLDLLADGEDESLTYYLLTIDGESYLLTAAEQGRYLIDGVIADCALHRTKKYGL